MIEIAHEKKMNIDRGEPTRFLSLPYFCSLKLIQSQEQDEATAFRDLGSSH